MPILQTRRRGRPPIRTRQIENEICRRIAQGESLRQICRDPGMPCRDTVQRWLRADWTRRRLLLQALAAAAKSGTDLSKL